jgi:hypothetical protein
MNKWVIILILGLFCAQAAGQGVIGLLEREYEYDYSGNRIVRKTIFLLPPPPLMDDNLLDTVPSVEPDVYSDQAGDIDLLVYPNPTTSHIHIQIQGEVEVVSGNVLIFNTNGAQIGQQIFSGLTTSIDLSHLPPGIYMVRIAINEKNTIWKVVKQ